MMLTAPSSPLWPKAGETGEDGLTWTFHLREGVKWYDYTGKEVAPVTAQDFVDAAIYALDAKKRQQHGIHDGGHHRKRY